MGPLLAPPLRPWQVYKPFQAFIKIINFINISLHLVPVLLTASLPLFTYLSVLIYQERNMSSGDWMCGSCQHLNFKKRDSCHRCRFPKFGGDADMASYGIVREEVMAGDWYCNVMNCGAHNYASRTNCFRCGASKEDFYGCGAGMMGSGGYANENSVPPGWKCGDWICNRYGCGVHNYASRMECYKCKTPKEYGGAV